MNKRDRVRFSGTIRRRIVLIGAVVIAACSPKLAPQELAPEQGLRAEAASPARGLAYAREACASCHAVTPAEPHSPIVAAPTFEAIANTPGMTGIALNAWLHTSHPTMPNLIIEPDRIDDLAAYISTLSEGN